MGLHQFNVDHVDDALFKVNYDSLDRYLYQKIFDPRVKLTDAEYQKINKGLMDNIYKSVGAGAYFNSLQLLMTQFDRFGSNIVPMNMEYSGYTFITRPRLNLSTPSLRQDRILSLLETGNNVDSTKFMIRCMLDSKFSSDYFVENGGVYSRLVNHRSPFNIPLCNCLTGISGWPDISLDFETTEGGFFGEDFTFIKGGDDLNKTYDLTLQFKDIIGGPIMSMLYMWVRYQMLQSKGLVVAYQDDIYERRLNYTFSIYRFILDPARYTIQKWAKATGCMLLSVPMGQCFDINPGEHFVSSSGKFQIPIKANKIEYNDYAIFKDFNLLVRRYCPNIEEEFNTAIRDKQELIKKSKQVTWQIADTDPRTAVRHNFIGFPYIVTDDYGAHLLFKYEEEDDVDYFEQALVEIDKERKTRQDVQSSNKLAGADYV